MLPTIILYIVIFLYGIVIGSFLNVCIYRLPKKENIVKIRSHCMNCGYGLKWHDLIPLFSYLFLGGRCRKCKEKISIQYPVIEALNGALYLIVFAEYGMRLALGRSRIVTDYTDWPRYVIGLFLVSGFLYVIYLVTHGRGIGGGDVKLMAVCGLLLGWQLILIGFVAGCIIGSVVHLLRMKLSGEGHVLAMGPYLSIGVMIAVLWGEKFLVCYRAYLGKTI